MDHTTALQEILTADPITDLTEPNIPRRFSLASSPTDLSARNVHQFHSFHSNPHSANNNNTGTSGNYRPPSNSTLFESDSSGLSNGMAPEPLDRIDRWVNTLSTLSGNHNHENLNPDVTSNPLHNHHTQQSQMHQQHQQQHHYQQQQHHPQNNLSVFTHHPMSHNQYDLLGFNPYPNNNNNNNSNSINHESQHQPRTINISNNNNNHNPNSENSLNDRLSNLNSLWDFLHSASDPYRSSTMDRNFETDSLWRSRLDDRHMGGNDEEDDISVTSRLFDRPARDMPALRVRSIGEATTTSSVETDVAVNHTHGSSGNSGGLGGRELELRELNESPMSSGFHPITENPSGGNGNARAERSGPPNHNHEADPKPPASIFVRNSNTNVNANANPTPPLSRMTRSMTTRRQYQPNRTSASAITTTSTMDSNPNRNANPASPSLSSVNHRLRLLRSSRAVNRSPHNFSRGRNGNADANSNGNTNSTTSNMNNTSSGRANTRAYQKRNCEIAIPSKVKTETTIKTEDANTTTGTSSTATAAGAGTGTGTGSSKNSSTPCTNTCKSKKESQTQETDEKCCICLDVPTTLELAKIDGCSHSYCFSCIDEWAKRENTCPQCKTRFTEIKRVHKIKTGKRKRGKERDGNAGMSCAGNVKKVKNRDQRSDYRQQNHLQSIFAHMEANGLGLNILLSNNAFLHHDSMPQFFTAAPPPPPPGNRTNGARARGLHNNRPIGGIASLASLSGAPTRFSSILLPPQMQSNGNGGPTTAGAAPSNINGPSTTAATLISRQSRLLRRGTTPVRSVRPESLSMLLPMGNIDMEGNGTNLGNNRHGSVNNDVSSSLPARNYSDANSTNSTNAVVGSHDVTAGSNSTGSVYDDQEILDHLSNFHNEWSGAGRRGSGVGIARSFAANGNVEGAGLSADRALEILDDSDDDDDDDSDIVQQVFNSL